MKKLDAQTMEKTQGGFFFIGLFIGIVIGLVVTIALGNRE